MSSAVDTLIQAIIDWIRANANDPAMCEQLRQATVARSDYTRTGYFVYFRVPDALPPIDAGVRFRCPDIRMPALPEPAGTSLFLRRGKVHYLEIYARGGFFPEQPVDCRLVAPA